MTDPTRALPQLPLAADLRAEIEIDRDAASHEQLETLSVALRDAAQNGKTSLFITALLPAVAVRLLTAGYRIDPSPAVDQQRASGWWVRW